ncbi:MAG: hypothetical protein P1V97_11460 [Planctomycetota bacterium]|nr:hypothetical protein [Planctomycetota bacterium]
MDLFFFSLSRPWLLILGPLLWAILLWLDRRRRKPRRLLVACEALLPRLVPKRQQRAQTRWTLDLILLLSIAFLASLILAGPKTSTLDKTPNLKLIVFERGLSTMAGERLARLKNLLLEEAKSWPEETLVQLQLNPAGSEKAWSGKAGELGEVVSRVASLPYDSPIKSRLDLFLTLPGEIVLITDKNPGLDAWMKSRVRVLAKARPLGNVSLLRAGAKTLNEKEDLVQVTVQNATSQTRSITVSCETINVKTQKRGRVDRSVELKKGEIRALFQTVSRDCDELRWTLEQVSHSAKEDRWEWDALDADNEQILIRPFLEERRVRVSGEVPYELMRALSAIDGARVEEGPPLDGVFSIVSGAVPDPLTSPCLLLLVPKAGENSLDSPSTLSWIPRDGFLLHAFETPTVAKARVGPPSGLGELKPLLVTKDGEILLGLRGQGRSFLAYCGFSLESAETDWSQQASFPLFFHSLLKAGELDSRSLKSWPAGTLLRGLHDWAGPGDVKWGFDGETPEQASSSKSVVFARVGIFRARSEDGRERRWAVSVRPKVEDFLEGFEAASEGAGKKVSVDREREESGEKGPAFFALLCILLLITRRMNVLKSGAEGA